jgi:serine/threonine protein kinase
VHVYGFVHKGIRPETVLIFQDNISKLAASFLLGFEKFRPAQPGRTLKASDSVWERNLYRHPWRQGLRLEDEYVMQHDIYSLGVCLLEIGVWRTPVVYNETDTDNEDGPKPFSLIPLLNNSQENEFRKAIMLKDSLVAIAQRELPSRMGDKYTEIVISCLTCLDDSNPDFSDESEFKDEDDVIIGVRYIEKILLGLSNISVWKKPWSHPWEGLHVKVAKKTIIASLSSASKFPQPKQPLDSLPAHIP